MEDGFDELNEYLETTPLNSSSEISIGILEDLFSQVGECQDRVFYVRSSNLYPSVHAISVGLGSPSFLWGASVSFDETVPRNSIHLVGESAFVYKFSI